MDWVPSVRLSSRGGCSEGWGMIPGAATVKAFVLPSQELHGSRRNAFDSEVFGDLFELFDRGSRLPGLVLDRALQAVVYVVVNQPLLGGGDRAFNSMELLDNLHARSVGFHHADDVP